MQTQPAHFASAERFYFASFKFFQKKPSLHIDFDIKTYRNLYANAREIREEMGQLSPIIAISTSLTEPAAIEHIKRDSTPMRPPQRCFVGRKGIKRGISKFGATRSAKALTWPGQGFG